jgi:hypothetical protein
MTVFMRYNSIDEPALSTTQERVDVYSNITRLLSREHRRATGTKGPTPEKRSRL